MFNTFVLWGFVRLWFRASNVIPASMSDKYLYLWALHFALVPFVAFLNWMGSIRHNIPIQTARDLITKLRDEQQNLKMAMFLPPVPILLMLYHVSSCDTSDFRRERAPIHCHHISDKTALMIFHDSEAKIFGFGQISNLSFSPIQLRNGFSF